PGDLQQSSHLMVVRAEDEPASSITPGLAVEPLPGPHDQRDPGRVDELALGEVEHDRGAGVRERFVELPLEFRRRAHIELATDCEGADAAFELLALHLEGNWAHRPILHQPSRWFARVAPGVAKEFESPRTMLVRAEGSFPSAARMASSSDTSAIQDRPRGL